MRWSDISFTRTTLRQFAALWLAFFGFLSVWFGLHRGHHMVGVVLAGLAVTIGPLGIWKPEFIRPIYTAWMIAVFPIGWLSSNVLLAVIYFGLITPLAIVFRLMGRDALQLRSRPQPETYWQPRSSPDNMGRYLRQY